jgi:hypothetical protein
MGRRVPAALVLYPETARCPALGGGKQSLPDDVRVRLELLDERRFGNGVVYLRYRARS